MNIKVSVIIPVYNAESYLAECVQSLLAQSLRECEFLFVDDGSRDGSRAIIERYRREDNRVVLMHQENAGVSAARNAGLAAARGEYMGFVDADDWARADMFESMYDAAIQLDCDVVAANFETRIDGKAILTTFPLPGGERLDRERIVTDVLPMFLRGGSFHAVWNKLFRSSMLREHDVRFQRGIALGEDRLFNMDAFRHARSMVYIDKALYFYREAGGSATRNAANNDYFAHAVRNYDMVFPEPYATLVCDEELARMKSSEFISAVISYIHVYYAPSNGLRFGRKLASVKRMLRHPAVRSSLPIYMKVRGTPGRYERWMTRLIGMKSAWGLYWLTSYSRFRNQTDIGG